jgi:hypothetical protein
LRPDRWEYGSHFHWLKENELEAVRGEGIRALHEGATLWGSGRAALLGALESGRARGWERVFVPSYLCQEVAAALAAARWAVQVYADHPFLHPPGVPSKLLGPGDVLLRVNTFGWRGAEESERPLPGGVAVIEDHTHDPAGPWARASRATLAFASLRKTCPVADGAVVWAPSGEPAPAPARTTDEHAAAADLLHRGMIAKRLYRHGAPTGPAEHRRFFAAGDARIGAGAPSAPLPESVALLDALSPVELGAVRRRNLERIVGVAGFPREWLAGSTPEGGSPFALVLDLGSRARRDRLVAFLVRRSVFPTILWPMPRGGDPGSAAVAARTLTLPCDLRYGDDDLDLVGSLLAEAANAEKARATGWLAGARAFADRLRG